VRKRARPRTRSRPSDCRVAPSPVRTNPAAPAVRNSEAQDLCAQQLPPPLRCAHLKRRGAHWHPMSFSGAYAAMTQGIGGAQITGRGLPGANRLPWGGALHQPRLVGEPRARSLDDDQVGDNLDRLGGRLVPGRRPDPTSSSPSSAPSRANWLATRLNQPPTPRAAVRSRQSLCSRAPAPITPRFRPG